MLNPAVPLLDFPKVNQAFDAAIAASNSKQTIRILMGPCKHKVSTSAEFRNGQQVVLEGAVMHTDEESSTPFACHVALRSQHANAALARGQLDRQEL